MHHRLKSSALFSLYEGVYPAKVGGMEIFNYYLINSLANQTNNIYYSSVKRYSNCKAHHLKSLNLRPQKIFWPVQDFFHLLFHPNIRTLLVSFSEAHWLIWLLFTWSCLLLRRELVIVIHHGKEAPADHHKIYRLFFQSASQVIAVSQDIKHNYDSCYSVDCSVIFPLVPFSYSQLSREECRAKYSIPHDATVISMVGTLKQMKNPQTIIYALSQISRDYISRHNIQVVYAGSGTMKENLKVLATRLGLGDRITFLGFVPTDKICEIFALTDIYLIASDYEGTSVSLLEAMFNRKKIIVSRVPGLSDMVKENEEALAFDVDDPLQLKKAVLQMIADSDAANVMADKAYNKFQNTYSYDLMLLKYNTVLFG